MTTRHAILLATMETKAEEAGFLCDQLAAQGVPVEVIDISLRGSGREAPAHEKLALMRRAVDAAERALCGRMNADTAVVVGMGGGTGGEIALQAMRGLPFALPKLLITTLPFDPRIALADNSVILTPTVADIEGLNDTLRQVLLNSAHMIRGLMGCRATPGRARSIGMTALGVTQGASAALRRRLRAEGYEPTVFHANGYGGAAFARFAAEGAFAATIDMTVHEITRLHLAGAHVDMPTRFSAASTKPQVVLPGGMNFIGLGELSLIPDRYLKRPHYRHSTFFTHVKLSSDEMAQMARRLAEALNAATAPVEVIMPMGGFSSEDRPGGAIEDPELRAVAADTLTRAARRYAVTVTPHHINSDETAAKSVAALRKHL